MADPVVEKIAKNIATDIDLITTGNGFNETLRAVRHRRVDYGIDKEPTDKDVVIKQAGAEKLLHDGLMIDWRQTFELTAILVDVDTETDSIDARLNTVRSDIEKKLMADITRGGFAYDTLPESAIPVDGGDGGPGGIMLTITVDYRTIIGDPFTQ